MKPMIAKILTAAVAVSMVVGVSGASAETFKLTIASGAPPVDPIIGVIQNTFITTVADELKAAGGSHTIEWTQAFGGSVAKLGGVLEAVESGLTDLGHLVFVFEAASLPLLNAGIYTPFSATDNRLVTEAFDGLNDSVPAVQAQWAEYNQVYLGNYNLDSYQIMTNFPVNTLADLKGQKSVVPDQI